MEPEEEIEQIDTELESGAILEEPTEETPEPAQADSIRQVYDDMKSLHKSLLARRTRFEKGLGDPMVEKLVKRHTAALALKESLKGRYTDARKEEVEARTTLLALFDRTRLQTEIDACEKKISEFEEDNALILKVAEKPPKRKK